MKLKQIVFIVFIFNAIVAFPVKALDITPLPTICNDVITKEEDISYTYIEPMPKFPGGQQNLFNFISKNLNYPKEAQEKGIDGVVFICFVVTKDGSITDVKCVRGVNPLLDKEAIRVVQLMPKWIPASQDGKAINASYVLPIGFKLEKFYSITAYTNNTTTEKEIFTSVEQMPQFPGGYTELLKFISSNLKYPKEHQETAVQGKVIIRFVVEKDGSISNIECVRSLEPLCDKEAIRVVSSMPKWIPGEQNGEPVRVSYILPIVFKLQK